MLSVCLVNVDYYMSRPIIDLDVNYCEFRGSEIRQVPVLQIFGITSSGSKACLHIHGVFPYIYIPYDGSEPVEKLSYQIAVELDKALNVSLGQGSSNVQHVYDIVLVSGIPLYGFHEKEHQFFKIYFYNPGIVKKACALLENGQVLNKIWQPHEAHINYVLQFMIDYNLHGMSYINLSHVKYRHEPDNSLNIPRELILPPNIQKRSFSQLEIDGLESDILNRLEIISGELTVNPGLAALWEEERQRKRNQDKSSQISFCLTQEREKVPQTTSHKYFKQVLIEKLRKLVTNEKIDKNVSVYPIETPEDCDILSATSTHKSENTIFENSQNQTLDLDETIVPLYEALCELHEENQVEEDSVLSQKVQEEQNSEDELNLMNPNEDEWNNAFWEDVRISQVDGACDSSENEEDIQNNSSPDDPPFTPNLIRTPNKSPRRSKRTSSSKKYTPLNVIVSTSKKKSVDFEDKIDSLRKRAKIFDEKNEKIVPVVAKRPKTDTNTTNVGELPDKNVFHEVKGQTTEEEQEPDSLNSDNHYSGDKTIIEETKVCTYKKGGKTKARRLSCNSEEIYRKKEDKFLEELLNEKKQTNVKSRIRSNSLSPSPSNNNEFKQYIIAEKYDREHNFVPEPGSSKSTKPKQTQNINNSLIIADCFGNNYVSQNSQKSDEFDISNLENPEFIQKQITEFENYSKKKQTNNEKMCNEISEETSTKINIQSQVDKCADCTQDNEFTDKNTSDTKLVTNNLELSEVNDKNESFFKKLMSQKLFSNTQNVTFKKLDTPDIITPTKMAISISQNSFSEDYIITPTFNPPSVSDVISNLSENKIPKIRYPQPYYSDPSDVSRKMDVGHNMLKIPSNTANDLEEFISCTNFPGLDNWRKQKLIESNIPVNSKTNIKLLLATADEVIITPIRQPPIRKDIIEWIKSKVKNENVMKESPKKELTRIHIPTSPGNESMDESFTMSPCSPLEINDQSPDTPRSVSPALNRRNFVKKMVSLQRKALFTQFKKQVSQEEDLGVENIDVDNSSDNKNLETTSNNSLIFLSQKSNSNDSNCVSENSSNIILTSQYSDKSLQISNLRSSFLNSCENSPKQNNSCQITGVSLDNTHGFKMSDENLQEAKALNLCPDLTIMVVEIHTQARGEMTPDPEYDSVRAIFYSVSDNKGSQTGIIAVDTLPGSPNPKDFPRPPILNGLGLDCEIIYTKSEIELFEQFVKLIRQYDPDIYAGYEIELFSWGYLIKRGYILNLNIPALISRLNPTIVKQNFDESDLKIPGRIILDIWRLLRHEIALTNYTFENIMYHVLHQRVPLHTYKDLSFFWEHRTNHYRHITANYYLTRVLGILKILDQLDLIGRTCELAKLFGIQFFEVLSRGSQFRVESLMLRLAKPQNYIPVSPSVQQRAKMRAPEFLPLILEPESRLYVDPVIVLDFQSLYPSIIIAHNYCFSTCIGRVEKLGTSQPFEFGATQLKVTRSRLRKLLGHVNFSPCGVGFVKPEIRKGVLPRMLTEILETRLMVKNSMKENKENKLLQRVLHSRQLGLKLIANVTYGYTAANFSGRMPCIEVGDSVVSKGRETLEKAIGTIEGNSKWNVRVVYGDTDSLFVLAEGRSREEAFRIGSEIAEAVTNDNPAPVKLKLEKILQPCILQTKKRYVGYMYESSEQTQPEYLAKGIETVRRDGCPAVAKILEKCLRMLFEDCDVSAIKRYVIRQFEKILTGRASIQDLIFAKEYRGVNGYKPGACVPALELAKKWKATDPRKEPRRSQRVPYIIINGPPGMPLIRLVRSPYELLADSALRPNALYYITKVIIPPINRCFTLFGADLNTWFSEMPRKQIQYLPSEQDISKEKKSTISQYFATMNCAVCGNQTREGLCEACLETPQQTIVVLHQKITTWERNYIETKQLCQSCCDRREFTDCSSLDCPLLYRLNQTTRDLKQAHFVRNLLSSF